MPQPVLSYLRRSLRGLSRQMVHECLKECGYTAAALSDPQMVELQRRIANQLQVVGWMTDIGEPDAKYLIAPGVPAATPVAAQETTSDVVEEAAPSAAENAAESETEPLLAQVEKSLEEPAENWPAKLPVPPEPNVPAGAEVLEQRPLPPPLRRRGR